MSVAVVNKDVNIAHVTRNVLEHIVEDLEVYKIEWDGEELRREKLSAIDFKVLMDSYELAKAAYTVWELQAIQWMHTLVDEEYEEKYFFNLRTRTMTRKVPRSDKILVDTTPTQLLEWLPDLPKAMTDYEDIKAKFDPEYYEYSRMWGHVGMMRDWEYWSSSSLLTAVKNNVHPQLPHKLQYYASDCPKRFILREITDLLKSNATRYSVSSIITKEKGVTYKIKETV